MLFTVFEDIHEKKEDSIHFSAQEIADIYI